VEIAGKLIWFLGVVGWYVIRWPYVRRSRRIPKAAASGWSRERVLLAIAGVLGQVVPLVYIVTGFPAFAGYPANPWIIALGTLVLIASLWLFRRAHKDLGRQWSIALEIRQEHQLVEAGVYRLVRHPMYSAFWLGSIAQALLLPNWVAGPIGLVGTAILYSFRIGEDERMMLETFGDRYRDYMRRTARIIPWVY
jgi:protein-S-isoprenylcysteine O-methyltransferase Ste14